MKKIKVLVILIAILSMTVGFSVLLKPNQNVLSNTKPSINIDTVKNDLSNTLKTWIIKNEAQYYKNITIAMTPVKIGIENSKVEGTFNVTVSEMLKAATPEELPAIRGMKRFRDLKKGRLSPNQNNAVNKELTSWVTELKGYIGKTETLNIDFKVVADLSEGGSILPETVNFFADNSMGDFYKIYSLVPTADEMEEEGFNHAKETADKAKDVAFSQTSQYCYTVDEYRRCDLNNPPDPANGIYGDYNNYAANYADYYTNDSGGSDTYHYNKSYAACPNDCANFVSQAMFAGGIPMSTTQNVEDWWCNPPHTPTPYSAWVWTTAVKENNNWGLRNYMYYNGYWADSDWYWANAGSVMMWKSKWPGHVAMVVQNDTINRALSAHNNNHQHYFYSKKGFTDPYCTDSYVDFYTVHHYVTYCYASQPGTPK